MKYILIIIIYLFLTIMLVFERITKFIIIVFEFLWDLDFTRKYFEIFDTIMFIDFRILIDQETVLKFNSIKEYYTLKNYL